MCGIVGFSGKKSKDKKTTSVYDIDKIKFLLYYNSIKRNSTDSIGFYHPGLLDPLKAATSPEEFLSLPGYTEKLTAEGLFIGHVRSRSVGTINIANAHPYKIKNIIGVHNGTLTDYKKLLATFNVPFIFGKTDSYYLYQCLAHNGNPEPIRYLQGSAALLFTDLLNPDTLYVYRKERELSYGFIDGSMYISSEERALKIIQCTDIQSFKTDVFYKITDGVIVKEVPMKTLPKAETRNPSYSYWDKWIRAANTTKYVVKDRWYLCGSSDWVGNKPVAVKIMLGEGPEELKYNFGSQSPFIPLEDLDITPSLNYSSQEFKGSLVKCMSDIRITNGTISLVEGDIVTVIDCDFQAQSITVRDVITGNLVTGVKYEKFRICTKEEEADYKEFLETLKDDLEENTIENIKFQDRFEDLSVTKLRSFSTTLLEKLKKSNSKSAIKEIEEDLIKTINTCNETN